MDKEISQNKVQRWLKKAIDQPAKMELDPGEKILF